MQKFIKNTTKKKLVIPNVVMELSEFERGGMVEICALPDAVVVLKREMTAMELIRAVERVTAEQAAEAAKKIQLDTIYRLTGKEGAHGG